MNPTKIVAIQSWPTPSSAEDIRSFLGLACYYRIFVHNFGLVGRPLTALLKRDRPLFGNQNKTKIFKLSSQLWSQPQFWLYQISLSPLR